MTTKVEEEENIEKPSEQNPCAFKSENCKRIETISELYVKGT